MTLRKPHLTNSHTKECLANRWCIFCSVRFRSRLAHMVWSRSEPCPKDVLLGRRAIVALRLGNSISRMPPVMRYSSQRYLKILGFSLGFQALPSKIRGDAYRMKCYPESVITRVYTVAPLLLELRKMSRLYPVLCIHPPFRGLEASRNASSYEDRE